MSELKAIQTEYKGYLFRSRLEARWALSGTFYRKFTMCEIDSHRGAFIGQR